MIDNLTTCPGARRRGLGEMKEAEGFSGPRGHRSKREMERRRERKTTRFQWGRASLQLQGGWDGMVRWEGGKEIHPNPRPLWAICGWKL